MTKTQYQDRKAAGLCPECGRSAPLAGFRLCDDCLARGNSYATRTHMRLVRAALGSTRHPPEQPMPSRTQTAAMAPNHPVCNVKPGEADAPGPNLLAHCGRWWPITAATYHGWRYQHCGRAWLAKETHA